MEELRDKLIKSIEENGRTAHITVHLSQELDKLILKEMKMIHLKTLEGVQI